MKICVLVKEVPDAAVQKRIDPSTGRMDRSGEKNLNPYDTHAIEAAMQLKESGALPVEEVVAVTMGPDSAVRALHKAVSLGADRSVHLSDAALAGSDVAATGYALAQTLKRENPDLVLLGQQSDDGECYTVGAVVADHLGMPSLTQVIKLEVEGGRRAARRAPGRVRLRHRQGAAPGRDRRRRRDQRAALPVAQGDHGREEEAARHAHRRGRRDRRRARSAATTPPPAGSARRSRPRRSRGRSSRTRTPTRPSRRSSPGSTRGS